MNGPTIKTGFIFDLDGTLVDSEKQIQNCLDKARVILGYGSSPIDQIRMRLGLPIKDLVSDLDLKASELAELVALFRSYLILEIEKENVVYEGVADFLKELKMFGYSVAIATSKPTYLAKLVIQNSTLTPLVDHVQGTEGFPHKPAPDVILRCMSALNIDRAIMFGDRKEDMQAAINSGILGIGIAQSIHSTSDLISAGATFVFDKFADVNGELNSFLGMLNIE
jgi:phosphoglycolate phosphatase